MYRTRILMLPILTLVLFIGAGVVHAQVDPTISIVKAHSDGNFHQGQIGATYTIKLQNTGPGSTTANVTVTDTPGTGVTITSITDGAGWTCTQPAGPCTYSGPAIVANGSGFPTLTVKANIADNAPATVTNTATFSGGGDSGCTTFMTPPGPPARCSSTDVNTVTGEPDVRVSKTHTPADSAGGFTQGFIGETYNIQVSNPGGAATTGTITVVDTVPLGLTPTSASGTGWSCNISGQIVTCTSTTPVAAGGTASPITLTVNVADNAGCDLQGGNKPCTAAPTSLNNVVTVSGGGETAEDAGADTCPPDSTTPCDDSYTDPTKITGRADLAIAKSHMGNFTQGDVGDTYTIKVKNVGGAAPSGTSTVTDQVPAGLIVTGASGSPDWSCTVAFQSVSCQSTVPKGPGASYSDITVTVNVASNAPPFVTNCATVIGPNDTDIAATENDADTSCDSTIIFQIHDTFQVNYFAGADGSRPDETVRITNPGLNAGMGMNLCANIYVFRNDQQLAECCSCLTTPNGLRTLSVDYDLTHNPLTPGAIGEGVIKIVSSDVNGLSESGAALSGCDAGSDYLPIPALRAWGTHNQDVSGGLSGAGVINAVTETHFLPATLTDAELDAIQQACNSIEHGLGSGHGVCSCGRGD